MPSRILSRQHTHKNSMSQDVLSTSTSHLQVMGGHQQAHAPRLQLFWHPFHRLPCKQSILRCHQGRRYQLTHIRWVHILLGCLICNWSKIKSQHYREKLTVKSKCPLYLTADYFQMSLVWENFSIFLVSVSNKTTSFMIKLMVRLIPTRTSAFR